MKNLSSIHIYNHLTNQLINQSTISVFITGNNLFQSLLSIDLKSKANYFSPQTLSFNLEK